MGKAKVAGRLRCEKGGKPTQPLRTAAVPAAATRAGFSKRAAPCAGEFAALTKRARTADHAKETTAPEQSPSESSSSPTSASEENDADVGKYLSEDAGASSAEAEDAEESAAEASAASENEGGGSSETLQSADTASATNRRVDKQAESEGSDEESEGEGQVGDDGANGEEESEGDDSEDSEEIAEDSSDESPAIEREVRCDNNGESVADGAGKRVGDQENQGPAESDESDESESGESLTGKEDSNSEESEENASGEEGSDEEMSLSEAGQNSEGEEDEEDEEEMATAVLPLSNKRKALELTKPDAKKSKTGVASNEGTLFVGNLPYGISDEGLKIVLRKFGKVKNAYVVREPSGRSKGYGYVTFHDTSSAKKATKKSFMEIEGRKCNIEISDKTAKAGNRDRARAGPTKEKSRTLFVANLPYDADVDEILEIFSEHGKVLALRVPKANDDGRIRGIAFVQYPDEDTAETVLKKMQGAVVGERAIRLDYEPESAVPERSGGHRGGMGGGYGDGIGSGRGSGRDGVHNGSGRGGPHRDGRGGGGRGRGDQLGSRGNTQRGAKRNSR